MDRDQRGRQRRTARPTRAHPGPQALEQIDPPTDQHRLQAVTTPVGGAEWRTTQRNHGFEHNLRTMLTVLVDLCEQHGSGVMITIDELHAHTTRLA